MGPSRGGSIDAAMKSIGTVFTLFAAVLAFLSIVGRPVSAQATAVDYDIDNDGLIEVSNLEQLEAIRHDLDGNGEPDRNADAERFIAVFPGALYGRVSCPSVGCVGYELTRDLDFEDAGSYASGAVDRGWSEAEGGEGWTPVGTGGSTILFSHLGFEGRFEGNSLTIANLYIDSQAHLGHGIGLFGNVGRTGRVERVDLVDVSIDGGGMLRIGGLAGINAGVIRSTRVTGWVYGREYVGGLVGANSGRIIDSHSTAQVLDSYLVGGLVGQNDGTILSSYATGNVSASYGEAGGLVAWNRGRIGGSYATGSVSGRDAVGGLVGFNDGGTVGATYATGAVSGRYSAAIGGLVGWNSGRIVASYSTGLISGDSYLGGLVGGNERTGSVRHSYWDTETSGLARGVGVGFSSRAQGMLTVQLQARTGYVDDFRNWNIDADDLDGDGDETTGADDPWDFGTAEQYPALKADIDGDGAATFGEFGSQPRGRTASVLSPPVTPAPPFAYAERRDYDIDDDGLIELSHLEQLDAVRYDLNGNGHLDNSADTQSYLRAFPEPLSSMGCPAQCRGYELARDLDFDDAESRASGLVDQGWSRAEGGEGWQPIGVFTDAYTIPFDAEFEGNGHTITGLFITAETRDTGRVWRNVLGLFGTTGPLSDIRRVGLVSVNVAGRDIVGGLAGKNRGRISRSFTTGSVSGNGRVSGGLVGENEGVIALSHSAASVSGSWAVVGGLVGDNRGRVTASFTTGTASGRTKVGGLAGRNGLDARITASYSMGAVYGDEMVGGLAGRSVGIITSSYSVADVIGTSIVGGLVGEMDGGETLASYSRARVSGRKTVGGLTGVTNDVTAITASYWDAEASGQPASVGDGPSEGVNGMSTSELQAPAGYSGIYTAWNMYLDSEAAQTAGTDDLWDFGTGSDYPVLRADLDGDGVATWKEFGSQTRQRSSTPVQDAGTHDYDIDDDGLIEISNLEQINAIGYDLDGDGRADHPPHSVAYAVAFSSAAPGMGCPDAGCLGYELIRDLDFDARNSYAAGAVARGWSRDERGFGWRPIGKFGGWGAPFEAAFDGNGHTISNLFIDHANANLVGLFGRIGRSGVVRRVGLVDVEIDGGGETGALVGRSEGEVSASYTTGTVLGRFSAGGLVGRNLGTVVVSYSTAAVSGNSNLGGLVGWNEGGVSASYANGSISGVGGAGGLVGWNEGGVSASYSTATVHGSDKYGNYGIGGIVGENSSSGWISASYWDIETSGKSMGVGEGASAGVAGKTTGELHAPTGYAGIYSAWNVDVDNADGDADETTGVDDPWDLGAAGQYPALKVDFDGDGATSWQEFGNQRGHRPTPTPVTLSATATPAPAHSPKLPHTGDVSISSGVLLALGAGGSALILLGSMALRARRRVGFRSSTG